MTSNVPEKFIAFVRTSTPTIFLWLGHRIMLSFDEPEQAAEAFDLLEHAINAELPCPAPNDDALVAKEE